MNRLFIRLHSPGPDDLVLEAEQRVDWAVLSPAGDKLDAGFGAALGQMDIAGVATRDTETVLIAPGEDILFRNLTVPAAQKRYLKEIAPYLMEEVIADPLEAMHIVHGKEHEGKYPVMAVRHSCIRAWLARLRQHDIAPDCMVADTYVMSLFPGNARILFDASYAIISAETIALRADTSNVTLLLNSYLNGQGNGAAPVSSITLLATAAARGDARTDAEIADATKYLETRGIDSTVEQIDNSFDYLCQRLNAIFKAGQGGQLANLIGAPYQGHSARQQRFNWRAPALVLLLCMGLKVVTDSATGLYLQRQVAQTEQQVNSLYSSLFPQDSKIVNVKVQMENHLKQRAALDTRVGFITLLGIISTQLAMIGQPAQIQIENLRYDGQQNTLWLDVQVKDIQLLDQLKQALTGQVEEVKILSVSDEQQWINGRFRITSR